VTAHPTPPPPLPLQVRCANIPKDNSRSYSEVQVEMRGSRFCLLPPGDTSSSNRLTEVILAGCIPVVRRCLRACGLVLVFIERSGGDIGSPLAGARSITQSVLSVRWTAGR
jgi:hypothetical protein